MALRSVRLGADEHEVVRTRTHAKVLIGPALGLVAIGGGVGAGTALIPAEVGPVGQLAVGVVGLVLAVWWSLIPFLRWWTTTYTLTDHRLLTRRGILNVQSTDLPLDRVLEVSLRRSLTDRMLGCGTLSIETAAEGGSVVLVDIPDVEHVHAEVAALLFGPRLPPGLSAR